MLSDVSLLLAIFSLLTSQSEMTKIDLESFLMEFSLAGFFSIFFRNWNAFSSYCLINIYIRFLLWFPFSLLATNISALCVSKTISYRLFNVARETKIRENPSNRRFSRAQRNIVAHAYSREKQYFIASFAEYRCW